MMNGLTWTKAKQQQLIDKIHFQKRHAKFGISCVYFELSPRVGAKIYTSEKIRDKTHDKQVHAAKHGLAPQSGDKFQLECFWVGHNPCSKPDIRYKMLYGYLTQNVSIQYPNKARKASFDDEIWDLTMSLDAIGIINQDLCYSNVGFIGNKMVCIDFDYVSCHWKAGRKKRSKDGTRA